MRSKDKRPQSCVCSRKLTRFTSFYFVVQFFKRYFGKRNSSLKAFKEEFKKKRYVRGGALGGKISSLQNALPLARSCEPNSFPCLILGYLKTTQIYPVTKFYCLPFALRPYYINAFSLKCYLNGNII